MKRLLAGACAAALLAGACSDPTPPTTPSVVQPTITDTFTGTLAPLATNSHPFVVQQAFGALVVTLTHADPKSRLTIAVGTPSTTTGLCIAINSVTTDPGPQGQLIGTATLKGPFCVAVSDAGIISASTSYTITVLHS
jgi:hypothetical protein